MVSAVYKLREGQMAPAASFVGGLQKAQELRLLGKQGGGGDYRQFSEEIWPSQPPPPFRRRPQPPRPNAFPTGCTARPWSSPCVCHGLFLSD